MVSSTCKKGHKRTTGQVCKTCKAQNDKTYREKNLARISEKKRVWREDNTNHIRDWGKDYRAKNHDIIVEKKKVYQVEQKSEISTRKKKYKQENYDHVTEVRRKYVEKNIERVRASRRKHWADHRDNTQFRLRCNLRSRLNLAINNKVKQGSSVYDLGCTVVELHTYLKTLFVDGMSWATYGKGLGKWSVDHIIPLSRVNLENREEFLRVSHFTNLQPLWNIDNSRKGNKYDAKDYT